MGKIAIRYYLSAVALEKLAHYEDAIMRDRKGFSDSPDYVEGFLAGLRRAREITNEVVDVDSTIHLQRKTFEGTSS